MSGPFEDPDVKAFLARADQELLPKIKGSAATIAMWSGDPDPKQAIEFGYTVLLDKPIIIVVMRGAAVPDKVVRVADAILEWTEDQTVLAQRIQAVMVSILGDE